MALLQHVRVRPYGVLGTQLSRSGAIATAAPEPDEDTAIVDPAGLHHVQELGPRKAGGAAGVIYRWLGIARRAGFAPAVREAVTAPCTAKAHRYRTLHGMRHVVHVVGPNFSAGGESRGCGPVAAVEKLQAAYANVLREFLATPCGVLRLLPVSGGIFAGPYQASIATLTFQALGAALGSLESAQQTELTNGGRRLELCVFLEAELPAFLDAHAALQSYALRPRGASRSRRV